MLTRSAETRRNLAQLALRLAAIGAMVGLCAYLAPRASSRLLFLLVGGPGVLVLLSRPQWGLVLLIPVGLVCPLP